MVYVDDKKYACATCIKGHRSSSCNHTNRPLIEVKKKGRPVTQCDHCRDLRRTKQVHVKCLCEVKPEDLGQNAPKKKGRGSPPPPTFPNGLGDVGASSLVLHGPSHPKQEANEPCTCHSTGICVCSVSYGNQPFEHGGSPHSAQVASHSSSGSIPEPAKSPRSQRSLSKAPSYSPYSIPAALNSLAGSSLNASAQPQMSAWHSTDVHSLTALLPELPEYGSCSCGSSCACPGCAEHRGSAVASASSESCPSSCTSCFDCSAGSAPYHAVNEWMRSAVSPLSPPPHIHGSRSADILTYPSTIWTNEDAARSSGLVKFPALECCGGQCQCPPNRCGCVDDCCGCCAGCACEEHQELPHYTGYQGTLRCGFQVSGERASCCSEPSVSNEPVHKAASPPISQSSMYSSLGRSAVSSVQHAPSSSGEERPARVPFQPTPGGFTLGLPDPQLVGQMAYRYSHSHQPNDMLVYSRSVAHP